MNRERLQQMVTMLRELPVDGMIGFDLANWYDADHPCGTAACAVGHACLNPVFNAQGLTLDRGILFESPKFGDSHGWDAVEVFFGLEPSDAKFFFCEDSYEERAPTAVQVADRVERFMAEV